MKPLLVLVLVVAAAAAGWLVLRTPAPSYEAPVEAQTSFPPPPQALPRAPAADEQVITLEIGGMCCRGCTGKLEAAARKLPGVRAFAVDADLLTARALTTSDLDPATLTQALTFSKYEPRALPK